MTECKWYKDEFCVNADCPLVADYCPVPDVPEVCKWEERTPKERGADKPKITCLNCKHLMFSDMYGECNKQLKIVNPSDTCEYAEPREKNGEVKHGYNATSMNPVDEFVCSECGFICTDFTETVYDEESDYTYYRECVFDYCPKCGAKIIQNDLKD